MCVHRSGDMCDRAEIAINEFTQPYIIFDRAASAAARDEEFKLRDAECVLHVHQQEPDALLRGRGRSKSVLTRPVSGLPGAFFVWHAPDFANFFRFKKRRDRENGHASYFNPK